MLLGFLLSASWMIIYFAKKTHDNRVAIAQAGGWNRQRAKAIGGIDDDGTKENNFGNPREYVNQGRRK